MLDKNVKMVLDLNDIKEVMVATMLTKYTEKELSKETLNKFQRFMSENTKTNTSKNSVDSRIKSLYEAIQKEYDKFMKFNEILTGSNQN